MKTAIWYFRLRGTQLMVYSATNIRRLALTFRPYEVALNSLQLGYQVYLFERVYYVDTRYTDEHTHETYVKLCRWDRGTNKRKSLVLNINFNIKVILLEA